MLGLPSDVATWAGSASTSAFSPSNWFANMALKEVVADALRDNAVNWSGLQNVSVLPRENIVRQWVSLCVLMYLGILVLYFTFNIGDYGWGYAALSVLLFLVFTDFLIYWVHRIEHHPRLYKHIHKPHHKWLVPTPFASYAFHPLDGYFQLLPYHVFPFVFPLHRVISIGSFVFVNLWSILIHDLHMICNSPLEKIINGHSHHTLHHLFFTCNYGQYFTVCDRMGGSYRAPRVEDDPLLAMTAKEEKEKAKAKVEKLKELEDTLDASSSGEEGLVIGKESRKSK
ncbi:hypothetical protein [Sporisorium scitamineum]|uniref:Fatty acid hydroxylase domain-containing protein n=1 Tax=Sporisorium scitamineum TaxID=49012 RepID=A0A0F7S3S6_9BASI|nr:hypothetical protein [Sporisorium scitamineum]